MPDTTVIDLRAAAKEGLGEWFKCRIVDPALADFKLLGMTDEEANLALNQVLFDSLRGLHGFPDSQRPK